MSPENAARGGGSQTLHNFTVAVVGDAVLDPDDARNYCQKGEYNLRLLAMHWGVGRRAAFQMEKRSRRDSLSAAGQRRVRAASPCIPKQLSCQTRPGQIDPLYPPHLRGLPRVRGSRKKGNFPPATGFDLV